MGKAVEQEQRQEGCLGSGQKKERVEWTLENRNLRYRRESARAIMSEYPHTTVEGDKSESVRFFKEKICFFDGDEKSG